MESLLIKLYFFQSFKIFMFSPPFSNDQACEWKGNIWVQALSYSGVSCLRHRWNMNLINKLWKHDELMGIVFKKMALPAELYFMATALQSRDCGQGRV